MRVQGGIFTLMGRHYRRPRLAQPPLFIVSLPNRMGLSAMFLESKARIRNLWRGIRERMKAKNTSDATLSYRRHAGSISSNWQEIGTYGVFLNACRVAAWRYAIERYDIETVRIIDFGCSTGSWAETWAQLGFTRMIGIDVNPDVVEVARGRLHEVHLGDGELLGTKFKSEACIGCNGVLVHILEEQEVIGVFMAAYKALKPGGWFICAVLNPDYYLSPGGYEPWMGPMSCTRPVSFHEQALDDAGFAIIDRVGTFIDPWFSESTRFIAENKALKFEEGLLKVFEAFAKTMREARELRPFSELLFVCRKPSGRPGR